MTRRVLLTGASGFIGRHAAAALRERGFEVYAAARRPPVLEGAEPVAVDLLDPAATGALLDRLRPTHLLHLAWDVTHGAFWTSPANLDWVAASLRLYRAFIAAGGRHVAMAGTCAEYDWSQPRLEEDTPLRPATLYGVAKNGLHQILRAAAGRDGASLGWGRIFLLYGPFEGPERLVSGVARRLLAGEMAPVGNGAIRRDFLHVADVAAGLATLLDVAYDGAVNVASGQSTSIGEVVGTLGAITGRPELVQIGARPSAPNEPAELAASGAALRALGFAPRYGLQEGLEQTVGWWRAQMARSSMSGE